MQNLISTYQQCQDLRSERDEDDIELQDLEDSLETWENWDSLENAVSFMNGESTISIDELSTNGLSV